MFNIYFYVTFCIETSKSLIRICSSKTKTSRGKNYICKKNAGLKLMSICDNLNNETSVKFVIVPNTLKVFLPEVFRVFLAELIMQYRGNNSTL